MKIVYCGDVVGRSGREVVLNNIENLKKEFSPDIIIVNAENSSHGFGSNPKICRAFLEKGVDAIVMGNHTWDNREIIPFLDECKVIVRPLNYPAGLPGRGSCEIELANGKKILITQLLGRIFMDNVDCPLVAIDKLLSQYVLGKNVNAIFVDIHAEATSEKLSIGYYLDGRVSAVAGTHTHVPTADAKILPGGTAYITDVGMCGDYDSILGFDKKAPISRLAHRFDGEKLIPSSGEGSLYAIYVETDDKTGLAKEIRQISIADKQ